MFKDYKMKKGDEECGIVFLRCVTRAGGGCLMFLWKCVLSPLRLVPTAINCSHAVNTLLDLGSQKSEFLVAYFH